MIQQLRYLLADAVDLIQIFVFAMGERSGCRPAAGTPHASCSLVIVSHLFVQPKALEKQLQLWGANINSPAYNYGRKSGWLFTFLSPSPSILHRCKMLATETTHLLGGYRPKNLRRSYRWIPYVLLLLTCVSLLSLSIFRARGE